MPPQPQSITWPGERALLLVHGVGNAKPGDYAGLVRQVEHALGDEAEQVAIYTFYYDQVNDWFMTKQQTAALLGSFVGALRNRIATTLIPDAEDQEALRDTLAEVVGDVVWPVLLADARNAVRLSLIAQLQQVRLDGAASGVKHRHQRVSIMAHSMGCFHTYEALHSIAADPTWNLGPATGAGQFDTMIFVASPVQLIRGVATRLNAVIPQRESIRSISEPLGMPVESTGVGSRACVRRTISVTGNLDPVGGHWLRARPAWSYMDLPGQESYIDQQQVATVGGSEELALRAIFRDALRTGAPPKIEPANPHSWTEYVRRHANDLRQWVLA